MIKSTREAKLWVDITPDMMSEEEKCNDTYIRHPPSYRSKAVEKFLTKLDTRCEQQMSTHPRVKRLLGSPRKLRVPRHAKGWVMKKIEGQSQEQVNQNQNEDAHAVENNDDQTNQNEVATENEATFSGTTLDLEENGDTQSYSSDFSISSSDEEDDYHED